MSQNDPDQIRADIEATRADLSRNVDVLGEQVRPGNVARRQTRKASDKISEGLSDVKDRVMGVTDDVQDRVTSETGDTAESVRDRLGSAQDAVQSAPDKAKRQMQGNPLAAGLIALGVGWLVGSLLPSSEAERRAATEVKDRAQPLLQEAQATAKDMGENLKPQAQEAVESVKGAASDATENVKAEGRQATDEVSGSAKDATETVKDDAQSDSGSSRS